MIGATNEGVEFCFQQPFQFEPLFFETQAKTVLGAESSVGARALPAQTQEAGGAAAFEDAGYVGGLPLAAELGADANGVEAIGNVFERPTKAGRPESCLTADRRDACPTPPLGHRTDGGLLFVFVHQHLAQDFGVGADEGHRSRIRRLRSLLPLRRLRVLS